MDTVKLPSEGIFTSGGRYDDSELITLVKALSDDQNIPIPDLIRAFGVFIFPALYQSLEFPEEIKTSIKSFLKSIEDVIHKEVKRMYPEVYLPTFSYIDTGEHSLTLIYHSKRKMCALAEGLVNGAAKHFNVKTGIEHKICMHDGHDHCELELTFESN